MIETEMHVDAPQQFKSAGEIVGRFIGFGALTLDEVSVIIASVSNNANVAVTGGNWADFVSMVLSGWKKEFKGTNTTEMSKAIAKSQLNIAHLINVTKPAEVDRYTKNIKSSGLDTIDPVAYVILSIQDNKPANEITGWIGEHVPESPQAAEKVICALVAAVELKTTFARKPTDARPLFEQYSSVLELFVNDVSNQVVMLNELQLFSHKAGSAKALMQRNVALFKEKQWISEEAIQKWRNSATSNLPGKDDALKQIEQLS
jgi:hypothetical protein